MTAVQDNPVAKEIGRDRRRKEDQRLITGRTRWTDNITLPGMVHLAMVRSPFAHARIVSIDTAEAKSAPNVVTVITGAEVADEPGQEFGLRVQLGELIAVKGHDAVLHGVELALQDGQRRAEFVRDVGDEGLALPLELL